MIKENSFHTDNKIKFPSPIVNSGLALQIERHTCYEIPRETEVERQAWSESIAHHQKSSPEAHLVEQVHMNKVHYEKEVTERSFHYKI